MSESTSVAQTHAWANDPFEKQTAITIEYHRIRVEIAEALGIPVASIQPDTKIGRLAPLDQTCNLTSVITPEVRYRCFVAEVTHRERIVFRLIGFVLTSVFVSVVLPNLSWMATLLVSFVSSAVTAYLFQSPQTRFSEIGLETVYELAICNSRYNKADADQGLWPREAISERVRWIVGRSIGCRFDELDDETRFVDL